MPTRSEINLSKIREYLQASLHTSGQPKVVFWLKIYCLIVFIFSLIQIIFSFFLFYQAWDYGDSGFFALFVLIGALPFLLYILPIFLPRKPWVWIFNAGIIGFSFITCFFIPFAVPIIFFWLKPEVKKFYKC